MHRRIYNARLVAATVFQSAGLLPFPAAPASASLKLTENCNARCVMCDYWHAKSTDKIDTERAIRLLAELEQIGVHSLTFSGGEPLLRKDLFEILASPAASRMRKVHLSTNGLLCHRYRSQINESCITRLTVSLDAIGEANDRIRGIPGYFEKVTAGLQGITKKIHIRSLFTSRLAECVDSMLELCESRGWNLELALPDPEPYCFSSSESTGNLEDLWPTGEQVDKVIRSMKAAGRMDPITEKNALSYMKTRRFRFRNCFQGYNALYVSSSGDLRSGCLVFQPVGNVLQQSLAEILHSAAYRQSLKDMFDLKCSLCTCGYGFSGKVAESSRRITKWMHPLQLNGGEESA